MYTIAEAFARIIGVNKEVTKTYRNPALAYVEVTAITAINSR